MTPWGVRHSYAQAPRHEAQARPDAPVALGSCASSRPSGAAPPTQQEHGLPLMPCDCSPNCASARLPHPQAPRVSLMRQGTCAPRRVQDLQPRGRSPCGGWLAQAVAFAARPRLLCGASWQEPDVVRAGVVAWARTPHASLYRRTSRVYTAPQPHDPRASRRHQCWGRRWVPMVTGRWERRQSSSDCRQQTVAALRDGDRGEPSVGLQHRSQRPHPPYRGKTDVR